ncbi:hypothetical protein Tco_1119431, partial [Tanacetum coccineum]
CHVALGKRNYLCDSASVALSTGKRVIKQEILSYSDSDMSYRWSEYTSVIHSSRGRFRRCGSTIGLSYIAWPLSSTQRPDNIPVPPRAAVTSRTGDFVIPDTVDEDDDGMIGRGTRIAV